VAELEQIIERCAASLVVSNELFWLANNTAAVAGVDYLAFHQARVAVLSMTIGASVGYDRPRQVQLGMAGSLIDVGLWQLPGGPPAPARLALAGRADAVSCPSAAVGRADPPMVAAA
jgi:hypothetical protein